MTAVHENQLLRAEEIKNHSAGLLLFYPLTAERVSKKVNGSLEYDDNGKLLVDFTESLSEVPRPIAGHLEYG